MRGTSKQTLKMGLVALSCLASPLAQAGLNDCRSVGRVVSLEKFTNYAPSLGGTNGSCRNATARGVQNPCQYSVEKFLKGNTDIVIAAVQRDAVDLYGGVYRAPSLEQSLSAPQCMRIYAGDRYGKTESVSEKGYYKMDILTDNGVKHPVAQRINSQKNPQLIPIGRMPRLQRPAWQFQLSSEAMAPIHGSTTSGNRRPNI